MSEPKFEDLLSVYDDARAQICNALRDLVEKLHPEFMETIWLQQGIASYGVGPKKMSEHYVYIAPQKAHVNLGFYHGVDLPDPAGLLEGTGKKLRHVKVRGVSEIDALHDLVIAAIEDRKREIG